MSYINICFSTDDNYVQHCGVAMMSILKNADKADKLRFYVLNDGVSDSNKHKILSITTPYNADCTFIDIDIDCFSDCPSSVPTFS